jgi:O-antigen/teichoic acid export membrane protein
MTKSRPNTIRIVRKLAVILLVLLLAVMLLSSAIGSFVVALLFGDAYSPARIPIAFFSGATLFIMGGLILSPIFLVEKKHWLISVTWTFGALVFLISLNFQSGDAILAAAISLFIATAVSYLLQYNLIIRALKK